MLSRGFMTGNFGGFKETSKILDRISKSMSYPFTIDTNLHKTLRGTEGSFLLLDIILLLDLLDEDIPPDRYS
jgi:hypothetical protein